MPPSEHTAKIISIAKRQAEDETKISPNNLARMILDQETLLSDDTGGLYRYTGAFWERISVHTLRAMAKRVDTEKHTSHRRRDEVANYIKAETHTQKIVWRQLGNYDVPFANGVLNLKTNELRPHRPEDFLETVIPHEWGEDRECPTWLAALHTYWGEDADFLDKVSALQEFMGYCLMQHARYKKALICVGESDTGKSQVAHVLRLIVGADNCCSVSVEDLDDARKRVPLVGKLLNILTEISARAVVADGGFKTLVSTEEALQFDPKFISPYMYVPIAKHMFVCNELPRVRDKSLGVYNRLLILVFNKVLPKPMQDRSFPDKLAEEIGGICRWAVQGAMRLIENGGMFTDVTESEEAVKAYRNSQNEVYLFIEDECIKDPDQSVYYSEFYEKFCRWSPTSRYTRHWVTRLLKQAGYETGKEYSNATGKSVTCVKGIKWE